MIYHSHVQFKLSNKRNTYERQSYTLFQLLGDIGGFNGAVIIFPSIVMRSFSGMMFQHSIAKQVPIRKPKKKKNRENERRLSENEQY